jgi:hypothetical protein
VEHHELPTVIHGFEPVRDGLRNRDIEAAYRTAGSRVGRVVIREPLGQGIISGSGVTAARVMPGRDTRGIAPAAHLLESLSRLPRPASMQEADSLRALRDMCREALDVLGPDAAILHGAHCARLQLQAV